MKANSCYRKAMSSQLSDKGKTRLSCRMDSDLMDWIKHYADQRGITVTQLIEDYFRRLQSNYKNRNKVEIEQI